MNHSTRHALLLSSLLCSAMFSQSAVAQSTADDQSGAETHDSRLMDIVVTAQKRSENLQDVPIAVSVASGEQLDALGVRDVLDIKIAVPTLNSTSTNGYLTSSIRGVGSIAAGPGVESPVAIYVDGVYIASPQASTTQLNNIASIEVLKGPQGTLFGRNATGGLIQITTKAPGSTPEGKFEVGYANYDTLSGSAYLSGPITSNLFADISFTGRTQGDGWGQNVALGEHVYRQDRIISLRSKWIWEAGADTSFTLIGDYSNTKGSMGAFTSLPGRVSGWPPFTVAPDTGYNVNYNITPTRTAWDGGVSLRLDQGLGNLMLSSITAYRKSRIDHAQDFDFTVNQLSSFTYITPGRQFSQELQLSSDKSEKLKWTAGLFYYSSEFAYEDFILNLNFLNRSVNTNSKQTARSFAGYAQATYELFDATNLTFGGRYTTERRQEKDASLATSTVVPNILVATVPLADRSKTASKFTYRVSLDHRFSDDVLGYISYNRGFKSGGFNLGNPAFDTYDPETLDALEVGLKADLLDNRLRVNLAGFDYKYKNIQVQKLGNGTIGIVNGASAHIYGIDADLTAVLADGLTLTSGIGWLSPKFESFPNCGMGAPNGGVPVTSTGTECAGNQVALASKFVGNIGLNYTTDVSNGKLTASTNLYYNSGFYFEPDNFIKQNRYAQLGASLRWVGEGGLSIGVFGKNLTNQRVLTFAATQINGNQVGMFAEPRTYGATIGYQF
ncbi:TonB-dependent receptor domain-containing protein [Sphingobium sp. MK2]|uniref:TonB-dependent receptor n=1 Tax=Sphingobium sp. MK2 TaxID=3116540 RepID=UPI0032E357B8